jgi:hypothetical protein
VSSEVGVSRAHVSDDLSTAPAGGMSEVVARALLAGRDLTPRLADDHMTARNWANWAANWRGLKMTVCIWALASQWPGAHSLQGSCSSSPHSGVVSQPQAKAQWSATVKSWQSS